MKDSSGHANYSVDRECILICNLVDGIDRYSFGPTLRMTQSYRHPVRYNITYQVTTGMEGSIVISGSDDGSVHLYDARNTELIECLRHGDRRYIVTIFSNATDDLLSPSHSTCSSRRSSYHYSAAIWSANAFWIGHFPRRELP